jgi:hypothetical protein
MSMSLIQIIPREGHFKGHSGALTLSRFYVEGPIDENGALAHGYNPKAASLGIVGVDGADIETYPIIFHP